MHPTYADYLHNVGITYDSKGDYNKAFEYKLKSFYIKMSMWVSIIFDFAYFLD
jgi:hypothetical protein